MAIFNPLIAIADKATDTNFTLETYEDPTTHQSVSTVLKIFPIHHSDNYSEVFLHQKASQLSHGVVKFYETSHDAGILKLRMEYCERGSLLQVMRAKVATGQWPLEELLGMYRGLLSTMNELLKERLAHRCIDCSNIYVTQQGVLKLGDFGHAKSVQVGESVRQHSVRGWKAYVSPELAAGQEGSELNVFKEDVWSLGKVFFEIAALKVYNSLNTFPDDKLAAKVTDTLQRYNCPGLATLLLKMMSREVSQRPLYADCLQALSRIEGAPPEPFVKSVSVPIASLPDSLEATEIPAVSYVRPALICHKCSKTKVLPQLYKCEHSICMECLSRRIKQEVRVRCEACGVEAALDSIGCDPKISWTIKESILNAFQEACEQRRRALNR